VPHFWGTPPARARSAGSSLLTLLPRMNEEARPTGLGVVDATLLVVGSIVGGGIFLVSHDVAQSVRSPAAFLAAWVIGGIVALAGALSNGELGGMFPRSGGEYVYLREAYGPGVGFLSGWTSFWIAFPGSIAALAAGLGSTVAGMLGVASPWGPKVVGCSFIVGLTFLNACGLRPGKWVNNALAATKLGAFAVLLGLGLLVPSRVLPPGDGMGLTGSTSWTGLGAALIPVLFAYSGWNAATYIAGEMRDPARSLARSLLFGTAACLVLYIAVNATYLRAIPLAELASTHDSPARLAAQRLGGPTSAAALAPLVALCVLSSLQATVLVGPRIYQAMAGDRLFFEPLGRVDTTTRVPVIGLVAQAIVATVEFLSGSFGQLLAFAMFSIVMFSTLAVAAVFVLRLRRPDTERPIRVPGYPIVPAVFVLINGWLLWSELTGPYLVDALIGLAIVATGIPAYAVFRARAAVDRPTAAGPGLQ
jgi:APA family basic amino acid/polyamine antiporter